MDVVDLVSIRYSLRARAKSLYVEQTVIKKPRMVSIEKPNKKKVSFLEPQKDVLSGIPQKDSTEVLNDQAAHKPLTTTKEPLHRRKSSKSVGYEVIRQTQENKRASTAAGTSKPVLQFPIHLPMMEVKEESFTGLRFVPEISSTPLAIRPAQMEMIQVVGPPIQTVGPHGNYAQHAYSMENMEQNYQKIAEAQARHELQIKTLLTQITVLNSRNDGMKINESYCEHLKRQVINLEDINSKHLKTIEMKTEEIEQLRTQLRKFYLSLIILV